MEIGLALGRAVITWARRYLVAATILLGASGAVAYMADPTDGGGTLAEAATTAQSLISIAMPVFGILLVRDLPRSARLVPTLLAVIIVSAAAGVLGALLGAAALALAGPGSSAWTGAAGVGAGGIAVQVIAGLVGTGFGLLVRRPVVAFLATIVVPLAAYAVLNATGGLAEWLTPYGAAQSGLAAHPNATQWSKWLVVVLIWGVGLNTLGAARRRRAVPGAQPSEEASPTR
jgi:hypothetical protein